MENLVLCPCGHALTLHDYSGCSGDRSQPCRCSHDRHAALEAAVDHARSAPMYQPSFNGTATDAA